MRLVLISKTDSMWQKMAQSKIVLKNTYINILETNR